MTPKGNTAMSASAGAMALCEQGLWREALEAVKSDPAGPERALIEGCALVFTEPETAKDLLSEATRSLPEGELKEKAQVWLACCYWATGEHREARIVLDSIEPSTDAVKFLIGLNASIFERSKLETSLTLLSEVEPLIDALPALWRGKYFVQRGYLLRRLDRAGEAIAAYESAHIWFTEANAPSHMIATVLNNLAGLMTDAGRFEEAHESVASALALLPATDTFYRAQFLDQKALVLLAQQRYGEAATVAEESVSLLEHTENKSLLVETLLTLAKAHHGLERFTDALHELEKAQAAATYCDNKDALVRVLKQERETAETLAQRAHVGLVETALTIADGKLRGAARVIGCAAPSLDRFIRLHRIRCHRPRKTLIAKRPK